MLRNTFLASLLISSAVAAAATTPARAGEVERAREAIAAADAKIHTAESLGAGAELPSRTAEARAVLAHARADFASDHRDRAIEDAVRASALADGVIAELQNRKDASLAAAQAAAHETAVQAQDQTVAAQQQALTAQQQAADANARAAAAEQAAAQSAADAQAARDAAAEAESRPAPPAQVSTTVTTKHHAVAHHATRTHVTRRTTRGTSGSGDEVTTTTSVTQH